MFILRSSFSRRLPQSSSSDALGQQLATLSRCGCCPGSKTEPLHLQATVYGRSSVAFSTMKLQQYFFLITRHPSKRGGWYKLTARTRNSEHEKKLAPQVSSCSVRLQTCNVCHVRSTMRGPSASDALGDLAALDVQSTCYSGSTAVPLPRPGGFSLV